MIAKPMFALVPLLLAACATIPAAGRPSRSRRSARTRASFATATAR